MWTQDSLGLLPSARRSTLAAQKIRGIIFFSLTFTIIPPLRSIPADSSPVSTTATTAIMARACLAAIHSILLFAGGARGFSSGTLGRPVRLPLFAAKDDIDVGSSSGGAGSWRSIAKEFQENPTKSFGGKRLNIAFVVSCYPKNVTQLTFPREQHNPGNE